MFIACGSNTEVGKDVSLLGEVQIQPKQAPRRSTSFKRSPKSQAPLGARPAEHSWLLRDQQRCIARDHTRNVNQLPEKKKISFQTWHQASQSQGNKGCKSGYLPEDREALQTGYCWLADTSMGLKRKRVPCPASLPTAFQEAHSSGIKSWVFRALPSNTQKADWAEQLCICSILHQPVRLLAPAVPPWGKKWKMRQRVGIPHNVWAFFPFHGSILWLLLLWEFILGWKNRNSVKILLWSPYRPRRTLLPSRVGCLWGFCIP